MRLIAIDGPAGSGKSTVARAVAARLGLAYLDTGAMYRSVAYAALQRGIDPADAEAVAELARAIELEVADRVLVDGEDATVEIRLPDVTRAVSTVAANPAVRAVLVRRQRQWAEAHGGGVVEGRDIGTVVFPEADVKIYLHASADERARRRTSEQPMLDYETVRDDINRRDDLDSTRDVSPLLRAPDALTIDTTGRSVDDVVDAVMAEVP